MRHGEKNFFVFNKNIGIPRKAKRDSGLECWRKQRFFPAKRKRKCEDRSAKVNLTIEEEKEKLPEKVGRKRIGFGKTSREDSSIDAESELELE